MKDRTNGLGPDTLSMYDQDVLLPLVFAVKEMLAVQVCLYHSFLKAQSKRNESFPMVMVMVYINVRGYKMV
jgi:hypothetical protein